MTTARALLIGEALVLHAIVKLGLRVVSWQRLQPILEAMPGFFARQAEPHEIARAVRAGVRPIGAATCLEDALVGYTMLHRRGRTPQLRFGVRQAEMQAIEGHAWVECDGAIVIGDVPELARYALLA